MATKFGKENYVFFWKAMQLWQPSLGQKNHVVFWKSRSFPEKDRDIAAACFFIELKVKDEKSALNL